MKAEKKERYEESAELRGLANEILQACPTFPARRTKFAIIYSNAELSHIAGMCSKVPGAISFKTGLQFIISIHKANFEKVKPALKAQIVIHELWHIQEGEKEDSQFRVRHHKGDYCEIPDHDKFSRDTFERIKDRLPTLTKLPYQTTMDEQTTEVQAVVSRKGRPDR